MPVLLAPPWESVQEFAKGPGGVIISLTFLGPVLVWSCDPPQKKSGHENE